MPYHDPALDGLVKMVMTFLGMFSVLGLVFLLGNLIFRKPSRFGIGTLILYFVFLALLLARGSVLFVFESVADFALFPASPLVSGAILFYLAGLIVEKLLIEKYR